MAGRRVLVPEVRVRVLPPQPHHGGLVLKRQVHCGWRHRDSRRRGPARAIAAKPLQSCFSLVVHAAAPYLHPRPACGRCGRRTRIRSDADSWFCRPAGGASAGDRAMSPGSGHSMICFTRRQAPGRPVGTRGRAWHRGEQNGQRQAQGAPSHTAGGSLRAHVRRAHHGVWAGPEGDCAQVLPGEVPPLCKVRPWATSGCRPVRKRYTLGAEWRCQPGDRQQCLDHHAGGHAGAFPQPGGHRAAAAAASSPSGMRPRLGSRT